MTHIVGKRHDMSGIHFFKASLSPRRRRSHCESAIDLCSIASKAAVYVVALSVRCKKRQ